MIFTFFLTQQTRTCSTAVLLWKIIDEECHSSQTLIHWLFIYNHVTLLTAHIVYIYTFFKSTLFNNSKILTNFGLLNISKPNCRAPWKYCNIREKKIFSIYLNLRFKGEKRKKKAMTFILSLEINASIYSSFQINF